MGETGSRQILHVFRLGDDRQVDVEPLHHFDQSSLTVSAGGQIGFGRKVGHKPTLG